MNVPYIYKLLKRDLEDVCFMLSVILLTSKGAKSRDKKNKRYMQGYMVEAEVTMKSSS